MGSYYISKGIDLLFFLVQILIPIFAIYFLARGFIISRSTVIYNPVVSDKITVNKFPVKIGDRLIFIEPENIVFFKANDNYVYLYDNESNKYLLDLTLNDLESKLNNTFFKIHRSIIVNGARIIEIQKYLNGRFVLIMNDVTKTKLISSKSYSSTVKQLFQL